MNENELPTTYRAAILREMGSKYEIAELPLPVPAEDEVLIRLEATGESQLSGSFSLPNLNLHNHPY